MSRHPLAALVAALVLAGAASPATAYRGDNPPGLTPPVIVPPSDCRTRCDVPPAPVMAPVANDGPCRNGRAC